MLTADHGFGQGDPKRRVPLMVKLPRQTTQITFDEPVSAVILRDLLDGVFAGEVTRHEQIGGYLSLADDRPGGD